MSDRARAWVNRCRFDGGPPHARDVLVQVAWRAADEDQPANAAAANPPVSIPPGHVVCWAPHDELAIRTGCSERTVRRVLKWAESAGVLTRRRRARRDGQVYRRTADALLLDLTADPVAIERDPELSAKRASAGRAGRAKQLAEGHRPAASLPASAGPASPPTLAPLPAAAVTGQRPVCPGPAANLPASGQVGRFVAADLDEGRPAASLQGASGQFAGGQRPSWPRSTSETEPHTSEHTPSADDGTTHQADAQPPVDSPALAYFAGLPDRVRAELLAPPPGGSRWTDLRQLERAEREVWQSEVATALWQLVDVQEHFDRSWWRDPSFIRDGVREQVLAEARRSRQARRPVGGAA